MAELPHVIAIGASAGGVTALRRLLGALRPPFAAAVVVVLHIRESTVDALVGVLARDCRLPVVEALAGERIEAGRVHLAPGNYHLLIERDGCFALSVDDRVHHARPSVDVLFASAADACGARLTGVVLTGSNDDGAQGLAAIRARGGTALVQAPHEAEAPQMPAAALRIAGADATLPLDDIALRLNQAFHA
ncbi:chemotaxis protein CheB [Sinimarinibacterium thermocellulolyticum]|uniref:protein-glutamate methylesterase n=1 Tax=Sinimarinibacterium thermocellulolyticum TaxID=3170016 RepID=A0ABV2ABR4_9GAMM